MQTDSRTPHPSHRHTHTHKYKALLIQVYFDSRLNYNCNCLPECVLVWRCSRCTAESASCRAIWKNDARHGLFIRFPLPFFRSSYPLPLAPSLALITCPLPVPIFIHFIRPLIYVQLHFWATLQWGRLISMCQMCPKNIFKFCNDQKFLYSEFMQKKPLNASLLYYAHAANASAYEYLHWALIYANAKML